MTSTWGTTTDLESTEQVVNCYSLKDLAFEGSNKRINTTKASWTIPASNSSKGVIYPRPTLGVHQENFLIWTSRAFDICTDINLQALRPEGEDERILNEIDAQQPISPITDSAEFQRIRRCSAAGLYIKRRSLSAAFSTSSGIPRPCISTGHPRGKPRKLQAYKK